MKFLGKFICFETHASDPAVEPQIRLWSFRSNHGAPHPPQDDAQRRIHPATQPPTQPLSQQPASHTASQPASHTASQPANWPTSQPANQPTSPRGGQTLPKTSHSRQRPKVAKLYKELNRKCESFERVPKWDFQGLEPGGQAGHPQGNAKLTIVLDLRHHDLQKPPVFNT